METGRVVFSEERVEKLRSEVQYIGWTVVFGVLLIGVLTAYWVGRESLSAWWQQRQADAGR